MEGLRSPYNEDVYRDPLGQRMGGLGLPIKIGDPGGERYESIDAVVDTDATHTVVPASRLRHPGAYTSYHLGLQASV